MNNSMRPHTLAVFAVGSTLDLRPIHDTKNYIQEEWNDNEVRPSVSHLVVYKPCSKI